MEMVPHRRNPTKSSMFTGLAATVKGKAASMQEDAKGKVGGCYVPLLHLTPLLHVLGLCVVGLCTMVAIFTRACP